MEILKNHQFGYQFGYKKRRLRRDSFDKPGWHRLNKINRKKAISLIIDFDNHPNKYPNGLAQYLNQLIFIK